MSMQHGSATRDEGFRLHQRRRVTWVIGAVVVLGALAYFYWRGSLMQPPVAPYLPPSAEEQADTNNLAQHSGAVRAARPRSKHPDAVRQGDAVTVSGHVENTAGERLENAVVILRGCRTLRSSKDSALRSPATGPDGVFKVTVPGDGDSYKLWAECEGYRLKDVTSTFKVLSPKEAPGISPEPVSSEMQAAEQATQRSWNLNHLEAMIEVPPDGVHDVVVTLTRSTRITGRVVDWQGTPVGQVRLFYYRCGDDAGDSGQEHVQGSGGYSIHSPTDAEGRFHVGNIEPGLYAFYGVHVPSGEEGSAHYSFRFGSAEEPIAKIAVRADEWVDGVEIRLPHESERGIEGIVVDENGVGVEGARVAATFANGAGASPLSPPTPSTGAFRVEGIMREVEGRPLTEVAVTATCEGFEPATSDKVPIDAQGVRVVMMRARRGAIALRLHDARTGEAIRDAKVAIHMTRTAWGETRCGSGVPTEQPSGVSGPDAEGWYTFAAVPEGNSDLIMSVPGYGVMRRAGVVVEMGKTTKIDLPVELAGLLCTHEVVSEQVGTWRVVAQPPRCRFSDPTDNYGFSFDQKDGPKPELECEVKEPDKQKHVDFCLAPGLYTVLTIVHMVPGTNPQNGALVVLSREVAARVASGQVTSVEFKFPPPVYGSIEVDYSGTIQNIQVRATGGGDVSEAYSSFGTGQHCSFPCVPPGTYDVTRRAREEKRITKQAVVVSGKATSVVFE